MSNKLKQKIEVRKIKEFLFKALLSLSSHAFSACLVLFIISLIIGALLFYKYIISIKTIEFQQIERGYFLNSNKYRSVLESWEENQKRFDSVDSKLYSNPFKERSDKFQKPVEVD